MCDSLIFAGEKEAVSRSHASLHVTEHANTCSEVLFIRAQPDTFFSVF